MPSDCSPTAPHLPAARPALLNARYQEFNEMALEHDHPESADLIHEHGGREE